jgi:nucleoid-associated protein YgaU
VGGAPEPATASLGNGVGTLDGPGAGPAADGVVLPSESPLGGAGGLPAPGRNLIPVPEVAPAAAGAKYVVKNGDTLERIARRELGAGSRWSEIQALNPGVDPKALRIGTELALPAGARPAAAREALVQQPAQKPASKPAQPVAGAPAKSGGRSYTVQRGDTLSSIAAKQLGDSNRWKDIQAVNPGLDPNRLRVGDALRLPQIAGGAQVARAESAAPAAIRKGRVQ